MNYMNGSIVVAGWLAQRYRNGGHTWVKCYLASGTRVLAQNHLKHLYPTGEGLFVFSTLEEANTCVEEISCNYDRHARAAREIAEEYFCSDKVLRRLLEKLLGVD